MVCVEQHGPDSRPAFEDVRIARARRKWSPEQTRPRADACRDKSRLRNQSGQVARGELTRAKGNALGPMPGLAREFGDGRQICFILLRYTLARSIQGREPRQPSRRFMGRPPE